MRADHTGKRRVVGIAFLVAATMLPIGGSWASQSAPPSKFNAYLAQGYRRLGNLASRSSGEDRLSEQFHKRALLAASGMGLPPFDPADAGATGWTSHEAGTAREQLMSRLNGGARQHQPLLAATAQVNFDCWVQPLPKGIGSTDGDECRRRFYFALAGLGPSSIREASLTVAPLLLSKRQTASTSPTWPTERVERAGGCPDFVVNGLCVKIALVGPTADMLIRALGGNPERQDPRAAIASSGPASGLPGDPADPAAPGPAPASGSSTRSQDGASPGPGGSDGRGPTGNSNGAAAAAGGGTRGMGNGAGDPAGSAAGSADGSAAAAAGAAGSAAGSTANAAGSAASSAADAAGNAASNAASTAGNAASDAASAAGNAASDAASAAGNAASSAANAAGSAASSAGTAAGNAASNAASAAGSAASSAGSAASGAANAAGNAVGGAVHGAASGVGSVAGHAGPGL